MARIRSIKPEFARSASTAALSRDARLLFLLLLPEVDDAGRILGSAKMLAGLLFPTDEDVTAKKVDKWLSECVAASMVTLYEVGEARYLEVTNFLKHQKVSHPFPSVLPPPPLRNDSGMAPESFVPDLDMELEMERSGVGSSPALPERSPNALWDALVDLLGYSPATKQEQSNFGGVVKQMREIGATPDDIRAFGAQWRSAFPDAQLTVNCLPKWWGHVRAHPMNGSGVPKAWNAINKWLERQP